MMSEVSLSFCSATPLPKHEISLLILISTNHQIISHSLSPLSSASFLALQHQFLSLEARVEGKLWYKAHLWYPGSPVLARDSVDLSAVNVRGQRGVERACGGR